MIDRPNAGSYSTSVLAAIHNRRSIRSGYEGVGLDPGIVDQIVAAGLVAPSSKNAQPWRLHVIEDRSMLRQFATLALAHPDVDDFMPLDVGSAQPDRRWGSTVSESADVLESVPLAIAIENRCSFGSGRRVVAEAPESLRYGALVSYTLELLGIGAAIENMWLAAVGLGLQAAFLGDLLIIEDAITESLQIEGELVGVLAIGVCSEPPELPRRFAEPERVVYHRS